MDKISESVNSQNQWENIHTVADAENRIDRIIRMESCFDTISQAIHNGVDIIKDSLLKTMLDELVSYYESDLWLSDYEADERGEIPQDLKRGVLSQDGVYNLLIEINKSLLKMNS